MTGGEGALYKVVVNNQEQHSIWPADRNAPPGWRDAGCQGSRQQCLTWVRHVWTDIRPLSLRRSLAPSRATDDPR
jgi:MbtH protein